MTTEPAAGAAELTIDELARHSGMTVRNIRAHQSRGLLPPPEVRGRTGFYGPDHLTRLELIRELQAEGFNLEAIRRLVEQAPGASSTELLRFTRAVREPWEEEEPQVLGTGDLAELWGDDPGALTRAVKIGLLRELDEDTFELVSPRLATAGAELQALGVPPRKALELAGRIRRHVDGIAEAYAKLFVEVVWRPFVEAGQPEERWPAVREAFERVRPLAAESVQAMFAIAMSDTVERTFGAEVARLEKRGGR